MLSACATSGQSVLTRLEKTLTRVRALPAGTDTHVRCPDGVSFLAGLERQSILSTLGKPDSMDASEPPMVLSYFLKSPRIPLSASSVPGLLTADQVVAIPVGGGYPEVTMRLGPDNRVETATCTYAK